MSDKGSKTSKKASRSRSPSPSPATSPRGKGDDKPLDINTSTSPGHRKTPTITLQTPEPSNKRGHVRKGSVPAIVGIEVSDDDSDPVTANYVELDQQVTQSTTFQDLWRIVRMVSAQPNFVKMTQVLEAQTIPFVQATSVRFIVVSDNSFVYNRKKYPMDKGIVSYVYHAREIVNLRNAEDDKRFDPEIDLDPTVVPSGALMCLPVVADSSTDCKGPKDVVGILVAVKDKDLPPFTTRDCTALYRLGEFAGNTMRNARNLDTAHDMYNRSQASQKRGHALLEIARALAAENDLNRLVENIVSKVPTLMDCDRCTMFFVDKENQELVVTRGASHGRLRTLVSWVFGQANAPELPFKAGSNEIRFSMKRGIAGHVGITGETVNIEDAHEDPRFNPEIDKRTGYRTRSVLCMPMKDEHGEIVGVLQAINKNPAQPKGFDSEDETMLATFSAQAAVAVKNSQLFKQAQDSLRRSNALLDVTNALSRELQLGPLIKIIVAKVSNLIGADRCTVFIVDEDKKELYTSDAMSGGMGPALPIDHEKAEMIRFPMSRGIAGNVATTGNTIVIPDAYKDERFNKTMDTETGYRTVSILCSPVKSHNDKIIGVIQVINKIIVDTSAGQKIVAFSPDDEALLGAFCAQAAVAIENSRLFTETERALNHALADQRNLKFLLSVTKNLFSDMHLTSMIEQMTMQVHHLLKADNCALYLVDPERKEFFLAKDEDDPAHTRHPFSKGIVGAVASSGRTVRISKDAFKDPRFHADVDQRKGHVTHSILCCPITAETQEHTTVIGVISVRDEKDRGGFEREEENLLKVFCAQAAVAIINSKRFTNVLEQSELQERDHSAAQYLITNRGMQLASDDIDSVLFSMEDVKLLNPIGSGSYGEVYRGMVHNKVVAVKKLHMRSLKAEQVDSFCKEASLMCQLHHPNVVAFIGAVTEPSNLCIITEYCARGSMADLLLESDVEMDLQRQLQFCVDAARGMCYLHNSNPLILHRDLKSDNLLVSADWTVKVGDFGLTRFLSEKKAMTQVGTPMWMAPEIILGKKYTEKADVYAFGIILWEILTRLEPYEDKDPMQIVVEVVNDDLRPTIPPEHLDSPLVPLMKDCWHPDPNQRPIFKMVLERLEELLREEELRLESASAGKAKPIAKPNAKSDAKPDAKPGSRASATAKEKKPAKDNS